MRAGEGRRPVLSMLLAPAILAGAVGAYFAFEGRGGPAAGAAEPAVDCTTGSQVQRAAFLVDLRKPLDASHASLPGELLRNAAGEIDAGTELAVYTLSPHAEAPRTLLGRLCKTFDAAGLAAESAKHRAMDECDVPAQAPAGLRAAAKDYCRQRDALARRIDALAVETLGQAGGAAHLLEALEATAVEFGDAPGSLYVFSDLLQHASWFSHAESPLAEWQYERMAAAWTALPLAEPLRGFPAESAVRIHYVPRKGTTELEDWRAAHKVFWEAYFHGTEIAFDDQPTMGEYVPASLADAPTAMELAAYELERLRHSSALVERDRARVERDRRRLEGAQREVAAERRQLDAERRELAAQRQQLELQAQSLAAAAGSELAAGDEASHATDGLGEGA